MTKLSPADIGEQIAALDATIERLNRRAADLSLGAVEGIPAAVRDLQSVNDEIALIQNDRRVLVNAQRAAQDREAAQHDAVKAEERAGHLADAKAAAGRLLASARRIDELIDAYRTEIAALVSAQAAVRFSYRAAGEPLQDARVGRANAEAHSAFLVQRVLDGSAEARQGRDKTMTTLIETAWSELLIEEDATDAE